MDKWDLERYVLKIETYARDMEDACTRIKNMSSKDAMDEYINCVRLLWQTLYLFSDLQVPKDIQAAVKDVMLSFKEIALYADMLPVEWDDMEE